VVHLLCDTFVIFLLRYIPVAMLVLRAYIGRNDIMALEVNV